MNILRKSLAVIVMILAALGLLLCVGGLVGGWAVNESATRLATGAFGTVEQYARVAGQAVQFLGGNLSEVKAEVDAVNAQLANLTAEDRAQAIVAIRERLDTTVLPKIERARATANTLGETAVNLNQTLESVNRIPGVNVPTFADELGRIGAGLQNVKSAAESVRAAVSDVNVDGARVLAAVNEVNNGLGTIEQNLNMADVRLARAASAAATAATAAPGWIDTASVIVTLLALLFGVGQVTLFIAALNWFKVE
jgi:hypothetical protein